MENLGPFGMILSWIDDKTRKKNLDPSILNYFLGRYFVIGSLGNF